VDFDLVSHAWIILPSSVLAYRACRGRGRAAKASRDNKLRMAFFPISIKWNCPRVMR
jgi:hypothetical protein